MRRQPLAVIVVARLPAQFNRRPDPNYWARTNRSIQHQSNHR